MMFKLNLVSNADMDRRNANPHIQIVLPSDPANEAKPKTKSHKDDNAQSKYDRMNGKVLEISKDSLEINNDFISIDTGEGTHIL